MEAIHTEKLTKSYGASRGICELDLSVNEGEFFGFIGPNGAGKSTTIRTLLGLIYPTSGHASVFGMDVVREKENILRRVGYLPSETFFYPRMRVRDALQFSAELRKMDCSAESRRLCERLQLDRDRRIDELSFGNRKKLGIVCALQSKPDLLILDEPTSGLDPLMQRAFFEILQERNRDGATIFFSSHVLSEVQRNCTRAAIIRQGRIIACDRVEAFANAGAKRVTLRGRVDLSGLPGIKDLREGEETSSFLYSGEIPRLLQCLCAGRLTDLTVAEPDLEEIFLHYYEEEAEQA